MERYFIEQYEVTKFLIGCKYLTIGYSVTTYVKLYDSSSNFYYYRSEYYQDLFSFEQ